MRVECPAQEQPGLKLRPFDPESMTFTINQAAMYPLQL